MRTKGKGAKYLALLAAGSMALAACATGGGDSGGEETTGGGTQDQTITIAWEQEFGAYNNNTAD